MSYTAKVASAAMLGLAVQQSRRSRGISQRELAERIGASQSYVWELESGKETLFLTRLLAALKETGATMTIEIPE